MIGKLIRSLIVYKEIFVKKLVIFLYRVKLLPKEFQKRAELELKINKHNKYFNKLETLLTII